MSTAVLQRGKRKTAGLRMTALVGNAQEQDDEFWGHDTWAEDDSGNESFRDSDEESALKKDEFDSDFNDSESDNEDAERAAGEEEERALKRQDKGNKQRNQYTEKTFGKKRAKGRRIVGDGMNAGIVLNFPHQRTTSSPGLAIQPPVQPKQSPPIPTVPVSSTGLPSRKFSRRSADSAISLASTRERRSQTKRLRENRSTAPISGPIRKPSSGKPTKKSKRRLYKQEELLIEAVNETEPENQRWLLARKRVKDSTEQDKDAMMSLRDRSRGKVTQKYYSRRGCLITLTFPDMDHVPDILTTRQQPPAHPKKLECVVTGKPARYKDPQTKLGYYDIAAFKELRRRAAANEPLDQRASKPKPASAVSEFIPTASHGAKPPPTKSFTANKAKSSSSTPKPSPTAATSTKAVSATDAPQTPNINFKGAVSPSAAVAASMVPVHSPSGERRSPRGWKPSEKMMQNIVRNQQHVAAASKITNTNAPPSFPSVTAVGKNAVPHMAPRPATKTTPAAATKKPKEVPAKAKQTAKAPATSKQPPTANVKSGATVANAVAGKPKQATAVKRKASETAAVAPGKAATKAKPAPNVANAVAGKPKQATPVKRKASETSAAAAGKVVTIAKSAPAATGKIETADCCATGKGAATKRKRATKATAKAGNGATTKKAKPAAAKKVPTKKSAPKRMAPDNKNAQPAAANTSPSAAPKSQEEQVYLMPAEAPNALPKYITQSELIMKVISNYNKQKELHPPKK